MGSVLSEGMKRLVREQRLGFVATVCPDGTPNLSPKGTTTVWDDEHLVFADIDSASTVENLRHNPAVEINVVDPMSRRGFRFKGTARVLAQGGLFDEAVGFYRARGVEAAIRNVVMVHVLSAAPLASPVYATGVTEDQVREQWSAYWESVRGRTPAPALGE
jgi:predicted pyridoxine 5'-phosphate oxidase superfamily flavin-nucleotide-binding protein